MTVVRVRLTPIPFAACPSKQAPFKVRCFLERLNSTNLMEVCRARFLSHSPLSILADAVMGAVLWKFCLWNSILYLAIRDKYLYHVVLNLFSWCIVSFQLYSFFIIALKITRDLATQNNTDVFSHSFHVPRVQHS